MFDSTGVALGSHTAYQSCRSERIKHSSLITDRHRHRIEQLRQHARPSLNARDVAKRTLPSFRVSATMFSSGVDVLPADSLKQAGLIAGGIYGLWKLRAFIKADADLSLLSRGLPPINAFEDKVVWITGASQGLGEELALYFAAHGARLILSSRKQDQLQRVKDKCQGKHAPHGIKLLPFDLCGSPEPLEQAASQAVQAFPQCSVQYLIHNAGASQHALAEETSPDVTKKLFDLNTVAPINLTQALLPHILAPSPHTPIPQSSVSKPQQPNSVPQQASTTKQTADGALHQRAEGGHEGGQSGCHIVVVGSMAGKVPAPGQAVYSACKTGLVGYFSSLQSELADRGITVTVCCPGPVATGSPNQPRSIYDGTGLITTHSGDSKNRMSPARVAELIGSAAYHKVHECWIARHPVLLMGYLMQYAPSLGMLVMKKIGPGRAAQMKGGGGYDVKAMLFSNKRKDT